MNFISEENLFSVSVTNMLYICSSVMLEPATWYFLSLQD